MKITLPAFLLAYLLLIPAMVYSEDMVVVANSQSGINKLSRDEVINIYLGRFRIGYVDRAKIDDRVLLVYELGH